MTLEELRQRVATLRTLVADDEAAHVEEDRIRNDVPAAIAEGHPDASDLAAEALMTNGIGFERWCA